MKIFAIDPGPKESAFVVLTAYPGILLPDVDQFDIAPNEDVIGAIYGGIVVIEKIASYGMAVGETTFETVYWTGRFAERAIREGLSVDRIERLRVKLQLCQDSRAKDANIRQALIDRWGGKEATKKGGALYKIASHCWAALAVGCTWVELNRERINKVA